MSAIELSERKHGYIAASVAALLTALLFSRALFCGFVNLDDPIFILNNPFIRSFDNHLLSFAFSSSTLDLWMPLTWLSFALDYRLWGLNPFGYHLTNIFLHSANSALVALIAVRLIKNPFPPVEYCTLLQVLLSRRILIPLLAALVFSLHPMRVESVAWVTERKDVLNGFFTLLSLLLYLRYADSNRLRDYFFSLSFFALSLMSKPVSVVIPLILLLLDYYPLSRYSTRRLTLLVVEKIPFIALSSVVATVTIYFFSQRKLLVGLSNISFIDRTLLSGNALFEYARLMVCPVGILPFYELPDNIGGGLLIKTLVVSALLTGVLLSVRKRPWLFTVSLGFLLPLLPVLSYFQNNDVAFAARYTYLPSVALSLTAAAGVAAGYDRIQEPLSGVRMLPGTAALMILLLYAGITLQLIPVWSNTETLWTRVIRIAPAPAAYMDRGKYYMINGRPQDAYLDFSSAIDLLEKRGRKPDHNVYAFRGVALLDMKCYDRALEDFNAALSIKSYPTYYYYRGLVLNASGKEREAAADFDRAGPNPPPIDTFQ